MRHVIPTKKKRGGVSFLLGRVLHPTLKPHEYEIRVVKPGHPKVVIGERGVYVLTDEDAEKIIRDAWEEYLQKRNGQIRHRTQKPIVEHPVEIKESDLIKYFGTKHTKGSGVVYF